MALGKPLSSSSALGVFCLESWSGDLRHRETVRPLLDVLSDQSGLRFIHRVVDSRAQLIDYLTRWPGLGAYRLCYLACHGSAGTIYLGSDSLMLSELADELEHLGVDLSGRTLYLGSCSVMAAPRSVLADLRDRTGLTCVCGYADEKGVDWLESAAFELLLFQALALSKYAQHRYALRDLVAQHSQMARRLQFKVDPALPPAKRKTARS